MRNALEALKEAGYVFLIAAAVFAGMFILWLISVGLKLTVGQFVAMVVVVLFAAVFFLFWRTT